MFKISSDLFVFFQSWIVLATRMLLHMFLLQLELSHLNITIVIQLVYCISIGQCTLFISYSGYLLFANSILDLLHLSECFSRMFLISAWLILSTSFISLIINPVFYAMIMWIMAIHNDFMDLCMLFLQSVFLRNL